jgi:hypothetical protein
MSIAAAIEEMLEEGFTLEQAIKAAKIVEAHLFAPIDTRSASARRQARYRERKAATVTKRNKASQSVTFVTPPQASQSNALLRQTVTSVTPLARVHASVEDNNNPIKKDISSSEAKASSELVDEPVDAKPPSKKTERVESDEELLDQVTDVWNAFARSHNCPQVKFLTKTRGQRCRARLKDVANGEEPIATFRKVLSKCETSFFIRGSPRSRLKFDQLMREGFLVEMLEGAFEYEAQRRR